MIGRTNAGNGGGLNLKVVGGTVRPTTSHENTVWVNAAVAITGYILSPVRPENGTDGLVWLKTADTGVEINVRRRNPVVLHLASCEVYTGSKWDYVEAHVCKEKAWVQFASKLVPGEYTAVEYIQSTGTQYIKTGITDITQLFGFEIDYIMQSSLAGSTSADTGTIMGRQKSADSTSGRFAMGTYNGGALTIGSASYSLSGALQRNVRQQMKKHLAVFTKPDGVAVNITNTTLTANDLDMYVFARNEGGAVKSKCKFQLFSLKFYNENDELISDLVPCYRNSDNVAGLWDRIREIFLVNAGTGTFLVGEALT